MESYSIYKISSSSFRHRFNSNWPNELPHQQTNIVFHFCSKDKHHSFIFVVDFSLKRFAYMSFRLKAFRDFLLIVGFIQLIKVHISKVIMKKWWKLISKEIYMLLRLIFIICLKMKFIFYWKNTRASFSWQAIHKNRTKFHWNLELKEANYHQFL